uniref:Putative secreted protein n=1 Tax=Rhipicephalus microplus TaxID=6941 RepID=A0A6M2DE03_RHIMP
MFCFFFFFFWIRKPLLLHLSRAINNDDYLQGRTARYETIVHNTKTAHIRMRTVGLLLYLGRHKQEDAVMVSAQLFS